MHFQINRHKSISLVGRERIYFTWALEKADGTRVCQSPLWFNTVSEARSQIALAKKSMKGAGRCKVVDPDDA